MSNDLAYRVIVVTVGLVQVALTTVVVFMR